MSQTPFTALVEFEIRDGEHHRRRFHVPLTRSLSVRSGLSTQVPVGLRGSTRHRKRKSIVSGGARGLQSR